MYYDYLVLCNRIKMIPIVYIVYNLVNQYDFRISQ